MHLFAAILFALQSPITDRNTKRSGTDGTFGWPYEVIAEACTCAV